jgi:hypothetical protein
MVEQGAVKENLCSAKTTLEQVDSSQRQQGRMATASFLLVSVALSAALVPVGAAAEERRGPACKSKAAKTLLSTRHARVFQKGDRIYACLRRGHRVFRIGTRQSIGGNNKRNLRLAGRYVAYSSTLNAVKVTVRNLRSGRVVHNEAAAQLTRPALSSLTDVKLKRTGAIAWIVRLTPIDGPLAPDPSPADSQPDYQVLKADRAGRALLDSGLDIAPGSLRLSGATVSWTKAGASRSAALN